MSSHTSKLAEPPAFWLMALWFKARDKFTLPCEHPGRGRNSRGFLRSGLRVWPWEFHLPGC